MAVAVRRASGADRDTVSALLDRALADDPVSGWIFPDEARRPRHHRALMGVFFDIALDGGWIDVTEDARAAALWLSVPRGRATGAAEGPALVRSRVDPGNERIETIGALTGARHPHDRAHVYLQMIGVDAASRGAGLGSRLIAAVLADCDRRGTPAYLEASSARSRDLYARHGFTPAAHTVDLPDGPRMWPMWREPRPAAPLLHLAERAHWEAARTTGTYTRSTRGRTLAEVGFIHCSRPHQLRRVADFLYTDTDPADLVVLVIDPSGLTAPVREEPPEPDAAETFPHIYGPLPVSAVHDTVPFPDWRP
ncbi:GNAT family N-acetyltransferase [Streptomyces sp. NPDC050560]|uniref:GNAT family N-acetyltransferase n=1 Tax=Streptomyces sp. NPDC050560 TaxID=3365630 RepID=UPI0037A75DFB